MARKRSTYIGSSMAPAIVGVPAYGTTALDVWETLVGVAAPKDDKAEMRWGQRLEPVIIAAYEEATGRKVDRRRRQRFLEGHPNIGATIDGDAGDRLVEAKFTPWGDFGEPADGEAGLPPYVRVQVKHQMMVTGHRIVDVPVLVRGYDLRIFTVEADPEYEADLLAEELEWWDAYVETRIPPPVDDVEALSRFLSRRHVDTGVEVRAAPEVVATMRDLRSARLNVKQAETVEATLTAALKRVMEDAGASVLDAPGVGRITFRTYPGSKTDWKLVAAAYRTTVVELLSHAPEGDRAAIELGIATIPGLYTVDKPTTRFTPTFEGDSDAE